jgi:recombinational DNA repair protein RecT
MQGQYFEYKPGGNKKPEELEKVFAVCRLKNGGVILEVMERSEIELARMKSQQPHGGPWRDWYGEMARKTAVRRLFKYIPMVPEAAQAIARDEERWEQTEEVRQPSKYQAALREAEKIRTDETMDIVAGDVTMEQSHNKTGDKTAGGQT